MLTLENVGKRYGAVRALQGVTMRVAKGEVVGLLGQNGAGKSTLINILTGYLAPSEGRVLIGGVSLQDSPDSAKRLVGCLPEQPPLYDEMTVESYLRFCAALKGVKKRAIPAHVDEIIGKTGLGDMRRRLCGNLSKGYRQRAGVAQALCGDPELIVLDEPTVGLDPKQITEIRSLMNALRGEHTILFSTHMLPEVEQLCDRVVILNKGRVAGERRVRQTESDEITLRVTVLGEEKKLLPRLRQLEGATAVSTSERENGLVAFTVSFRGLQTPEKQAFDLFSGMGCPIIEMVRARDSLESVFLEAISEV